MTLRQFIKDYTTTRKDGSLRILRDYKEKFGAMPFEQAYEQEQARISKIAERRMRIQAFEEFLIQQGARCENSRISESRYYYYKGVKYRFSAHIYPTGSMTNEMLNIVDFAADIHLIDDISF